MVDRQESISRRATRPQRKIAIHLCYCEILLIALDVDRQQSSSRTRLDVISAPATGCMPPTSTSSVMQLVQLHLGHHYEDATATNTLAFVYVDVQSHSRERNGVFFFNGLSAMSHPRGRQS